MVSADQNVPYRPSFGSIAAWIGAWIWGLTIFRGQQYIYASCSKAGGCQAAQLLGGFRGNLLIVSRVSPTPGCTANFFRKLMQPASSAANRVFCAHSADILIWSRATMHVHVVKYQVETLFTNFPVSTSVSTSKKSVDKGQDLGITANP